MTIDTDAFDINDISHMQQHICFVGAGSMAEAIIKGIIDTRLVQPKQISALNRGDVVRMRELAARYGVHTPATELDKDQSIQAADIIVLAMKPKDAAEAIRRIAPLLREDQLLVSVIAGLKIATLIRLIGHTMPVARTMPNTSSMIGLGATGISFSERVSDVQQKTVAAMFSSVGIVHIVDEPLLDSVTGVSGSGPAYVYAVMEAMIQGGIECGLSPDTARDLTVQTVLGAARMVQATGEDPAALRRKVTSPGGTTQAALELLATYRMQEAVAKAVQRAAERAKELGANNDDDA